VAQRLEFLRGAANPSGNSETYETSLLIMALAAANPTNDDRSRIAKLARTLENRQITADSDTGMWGYGGRRKSADNSNTQFAILALREAAAVGVPINRNTWRMAAEHFLGTQMSNGGWGYQNRGPTTGSMTCAGIASMIICDQQLISSQNELNADGTPTCCEDPSPYQEAIRRGIQWMERRFSIDNPGRGGSRIFYYLYGLERVGRLSGRRFFGRADWYRDGAEYLIGQQNSRDGSWQEEGGSDSDRSLSTSFALLFLSKGLAPVVINKLNYGLPKRARNVDANKISNWNRHPNDVRNLTEHLAGLPRWPRLMTFQELDLATIVARGSVRDLLQAPILYISGLDEPNFTDAEVALMRSYVENGGFIFPVNNCNGAGFDRGIRKLAAQIHPTGAALFKRLPPEHPVYRAEHFLDPTSTELWGVDFGCRTTFIYSPEDHSCLWNKWSPRAVPGRSVTLETAIDRALRVGVNVVALATGRQPRNKLDMPQEPVVTAGRDEIERGLLQVAKLRHTGDWDAAPQALGRALSALNRMSGILASTRQRNLEPGDPNLFRYPLAYLHGRSRFQFSPPEVAKLRQYLDRGAVLFADACCASPNFDQSVRDLVQQLYPDKKLQRIPLSHEIFSDRIGFDIRKVKLRIPPSGNLSDPLELILREGEPYLEGIEINHRYCVIYSKYDISCALERQAQVGCAGYDFRDAVRIAVNVIRYALLQQISYDDAIK